MPVLVTVIPTCRGIVILDLGWLTIIPLFLGAAVAMGYSAMLHYLAVEAGMRPLLLDINANLSPRMSAAGSGRCRFGPGWSSRCR